MKNQANTKVIFQLNVDLKQEAMKALKSEGLNVSDYLRLCLERFVAHHKQKAKSGVNIVADDVILNVI